MNVRGNLNEKDVVGFNKPENKRDLPTFLCRAGIYQCERLPPCDSTGTSDPYISVYKPGQDDIVTDVCSDTNNPIFYQVVEFPF